MKKAPISVRIIYFFSVIIFWLLTVITIALFIGNIVFQTNIISEEFQLRITMPINFDVEETGTTQIYGKDNKVRIEEARGQIHVIDTPPRLTKNIIGIAFAVAAIGLFMVWKFKMFITNIKNGIIFETSNINNLKHISYGIMTLWLLTKIYMWVLYFTVIKYVEFDSILLSTKVNDDSDYLVIAMLLWVLAHVFMKGVEMKEEQELTV